MVAIEQDNLPVYQMLTCNMSDDYWNMIFTKVRPLYYSILAISNMGPYKVATKIGIKTREKDDHHSDDEEGNDADDDDKEDDTS